MKHKVKNIIPNSPLFFVVLIIMDILLFVNSLAFGIVGFVFLVVLIVMDARSAQSNKKKWAKYIEKLNEEIDSASRNTFLYLPMPLTLLDISGKIVWYNSKFSELFSSEKELIDAPINKIVSQVDLDKILRDELDTLEIKLGDRYFSIRKSITKVDRKNTEERFIIVLYWFDITDHVQLRETHHNEKTILALLQLDNYDEVMSSTKEEKIPFVLSEIDSRINLWTSRMNGVIKKYEKDKYIVAFEQRNLENMELKRFSILDDIREISVGNKISPTLSIGISTGGKNLGEQEEEAYSGLELALGRGGDQAVVKKTGNFEFYGGKTKAVERRNRVKARIIAHAFRPLIDESDQIFIMGHRFPDMDSFGAAIGVARAVLNRGKLAYIVLNEVTEPIRNIYEYFREDDNFTFITPEEAINISREEDLLVVVDTHRPNFTESPELLDHLPRKVLFDHHRRGTEYIEKAALNYVEPYASSTCELVTEVLQYMEDKLVLEEHEAEALLAGIIVDTKSFTFKTGVRTFEAAALLKRFGADTLKVRELFQDDFETIITKSNIVSNANIYRENIAISICESELNNIKVIASQGADELLNIKGIKTSFVIGRKPDGVVFVSGRSDGGVNVQIIMEKLGGGGHLTTAGTQISDRDTEEVRVLLMQAIDEYFKEEES